MSKLKNLRAAFWNTLRGVAYTYDPKRNTVERMVSKETIYATIARFEVPSLPSDNPEIKWWHGYHQAQLDIKEAIEKL